MSDEITELPTAWSILSVLPTAYSLGTAPVAGSSGRTMDDVLSMDAVIDMDTLEEAGGTRTMSDVLNLDAVVNMNTLEEQ